MGKWASTRSRARSNVAIAVWPWGAYLGEEGIEKGVRVKVSSWQRHDPNAMPPAAKGTGMYINSSMAKVEALKAGYDEAVLLSPQGYVSECTGENIFVVRDDRLITPPSSAGALEGITQDSVLTIAKDLGVEVEYANILRSDLYTADEAFMSGDGGRGRADLLGRRQAGWRRHAGCRGDPEDPRRPYKAAVRVEHAKR